ncbi:hypothetical protein [Microbacterium testaceum]|nr:hypothetical protein [Microbacterium testaceum]
MLLLLLLLLLPLPLLPLLAVAGRRDCSPPRPLAVATAHRCDKRSP